MRLDALLCEEGLSYDANSVMPAKAGIQVFDWLC